MPGPGARRVVASGLAAALLLGGAGWIGVHLGERSERRVLSAAARERVILAASSFARPVVERVLVEESGSLLPDDRLIARIHLAKIGLRPHELLPLLDTARRRGLAPAESLQAWGILPLQAALARRMALFEPPGNDLDSIAGISDACLALDSTLLDCHLTAILAAALDRNWQLFDRRTDRALEMRPGDFRLQGFRGIGLLREGDLARAGTWIPDARYQAAGGAPHEERLAWSAQIFRPWRATLDGPPSDSLCRHLEISDKICHELRTRPSAHPDRHAPSDGFLVCALAPDTRGAIYLCRIQTGTADYPQHGKDPLRAP